MIKRCFNVLTQCSSKTYHNLSTSLINRNRSSSYSFGSKSINDEMAEFSDRLSVKQLIKNEKEEQILKNYMQLTEESYLQHLVAQHKNVNTHQKIDPNLILMIIPTLQKQETIRQHLIMLFPYLPLFNSKELLLFFQYMLAYKIKSKPKIPPPKSLINCQSILVILSQLYPKQFLIEWLKQVPLYSGYNTFLVAMGTFSIISGLPDIAAQKNEKVIERCYNRVTEMFEYEDSEVRSGVILLALQMNLQISEELILQPYSLLFHQLDGIKLSLLLIQLDLYLRTRYSSIKSTKPLNIKQQQTEQLDQDVQIDTGVDISNSKKKPKRKQKVVLFNYSEASQQNIKYMLQEYLLKIVRYLISQDWDNVIKLHTFVKFYSTLKGRKLQAAWNKFAERLFNFTIKKQQLALITNLTTHQLIEMIQVVESLKINKPVLIKSLLIVLSERLEDASKEELIRLSKCLVTYVRVCQDYLIHFRTIIQRRKLIFSFQDINKLNDIFRRVQVLFPKPLVY